MYKIQTTEILEKKSIKLNLSNGSHHSDISRENGIKMHELAKTPSQIFDRTLNLTGYVQLDIYPRYATFLSVLKKK